MVMMFVIGCIGRYFNLTLGLLLVAAVAIVAVITFSSKIHKQSSDIEQRFIDNLSAREREQEKNRSVRREVEDRIAALRVQRAEQPPARILLAAGEDGLTVTAE